MPAMAHTPESQIGREEHNEQGSPELKLVGEPIFDCQKKVLAIMAHPDDADFSCGGFLTRLGEEGHHVTLYVATSGQKGRDRHTHQDEEEFSAMRQREQFESGAILGLVEVQFGSFVDGHTHAEHGNMVETFTEMIRTYQPDILIVADPYTRLYRQHPDHRNVGLAALDASFPAAGMNTYYPDQFDKGLLPWWVEQVWLVFSDRVDVAVELSDEHVMRKTKALACHWTQRDSHGVEQSVAVRERAADAYASLEWAETFAHSWGNR